MRTTQLKTWSLVAVLAMSACSFDHLVRYRGYARVVDEFEGGLVEVVVVGTPNELSGGVTEHAAPYSIILWVKMESLPDSVRVTEVHVSAALGGEEYEGVRSEASFERSSMTDAFYARIEIPTSVPYVDLSFAAVIELWSDGISVTRSLTATLLTETREESRSLSEQFKGM